MDGLTCVFIGDAKKHYLYVNSENAGIDCHFCLSCWKISCPSQSWRNSSALIDSMMPCFLLSMIKQDKLKGSFPTCRDSLIFNSILTFTCKARILANSGWLHTDDPDTRVPVWSSNMKVCRSAEARLANCEERCFTWPEAWHHGNGDRWTLPKTKTTWHLGTRNPTRKIYTSSNFNLLVIFFVCDLGSFRDGKSWTSEYWMSLEVLWEISHQIASL